MNGIVPPLRPRCFQHRGLLISSPLGRSAANTVVPTAYLIEPWALNGQAFRGPVIMVQIESPGQRKSRGRD